MLIDFMQFIANLILANFLLHYLQVKLADRNSPAAPALAFVS